MNASKTKAQEIEKLQVEKKQLVEEIDAANKILQSTETKKKNTLQELVGITRKINKRRDLLQTITGEIGIFKDSLDSIQQDIETLEKHLRTLEEEYSRMSQQLLIHEKISSDLSFLLSAKNIQEAHSRILFLNQYQNVRKRQLKNLVETIHELHLKHTQFETLLIEKEQLLQEKEEQHSLLEKEKKSQNGILEKLKSKQSEIEKQLEQKNKIIDEIDRKIKVLIEKTIAENPEKDRLLLSDVFEDNKGSFPPPIRDAVVIRSFGVQEHPSIPGIKIKNNGIDLITENKSPIRPIFDGEIRGVMNVPGYGEVVLISHGSYFSLYGNLDAAKLNKGMQVNTQTIIGNTVLHPEFDQHTVHIEIWKGKEKLNPEHWIKVR